MPWEFWWYWPMKSGGLPRITASAAVRRQCCPKDCVYSGLSQMPLPFVDATTAQDRRALAVLVNRLPEATDTQAYMKARALLDKTKH